MLNEMSPYILLGFFIAGLMHTFVPQKTFARHLVGTGWRSVVIIDSRGDKQLWGNVTGKSNTIRLAP